MNVNKKLGRFKQWAGERMGGEVKTNLSDDFKALELEMNLRHEGMERLQKSMTSYMRAMSKRNEGEDKEKNLPVGFLGGTMVNHGEDFERDSEFGQCLTSFGRTHERIARVQEQYVSDATATWLESLERSLNQMKEYQAARKKLENRRLAYDTTLAKMQKARREDFRAEEELRTQKVKYEEACEDVYRRMQEIKETEGESVLDLESFLDAELNYYDRCRDALVQLKNDWPSASPTTTQQQPISIPSSRRTGRPRSNTAHSYQERYEPVREEPQSDYRPVLKPSRTVASHQMDPSSRDSSCDRYQRPALSRTPTFEGPTQARRGPSPADSLRNTSGRIASESGSSSLSNARSQLRVISKGNGIDQHYDSTDDTSPVKGSPDRFFAAGGRSISPHTANGSTTSLRSTNGLASNSGTPLSKKAPPPPPPRAKKPPPPPPPMKRVISGMDLRA